MIDFILGIGLIMLGIFAFWTVLCVIFKVCLKIADVIFG
jgi:hypothetical protein